MKYNLLLTKWCVEMCGLISDILILVLIEVFCFVNGNAFPCVSLFSSFASQISPHSSGGSFSSLLLFQLPLFPAFLSSLNFFLSHKFFACIFYSVCLLFPSPPFIVLFLCPFCCSLKKS